MTASTVQRHQAIHLRARVYTAMRAFFAARNVTEVETPILSQAGNTDPNISSFVTEFSGPHAAGSARRWLRTSPEFALKRLLAEGFGDCYELGRVFRNAEAGRRHNPEFTMLEWYRLGWGYRQLIDEVIALVQTLLQAEGLSARVEQLSYRQLYQRGLGLDPMTAELAALQAPLQAFRIDPQGLTRDDWLDLLMTHCLQPGFADDQITVIYDFPASQCALARVRAEQPPVAERFELYLGQRELANGYHELNDPGEQTRRFEHDCTVRQGRGQDEVAMDVRLLAVLQDMPACAGVALGIERLLMHLAGADSIEQVLVYPFAQA